jgi:Nickel responsive protein SCO4226-like
MPTFLVEAYMPRSHAKQARAAGERAQAAADELSHEGVSVHYVRTTFLPDDETCFHIFKAASAAAVENVSRRAALGHARIVPVLEESRPARRRGE